MDPREVLEISAKATPGPWIIKREDLGDESTCVAPIEIIGANNFYVVSNEGGLASMVHEWSVEELEANANLITLARTALPELAQRVIELEEKWQRFICEEAEHQEKVCIAECSNRKHGYCYDMQRCEKLEAESAKLRLIAQKGAVSDEQQSPEKFGCVGFGA